MSGSDPLLIEDFPFLFRVRILIVGSLLLFPYVAVFPVLSVSVDTSPLVFADPPAFASVVNLLLFVIVADHPISDINQTTTGLFLPFGFKIFYFDD